MRVAERTRKALEGSIKKWERIADGTGADYAYHNCPLCKLFSIACTLFPAAGGKYRCPVYEETGKMACNRTPYSAWNLHQYNEHEKACDARRKIHDCPECKRLAEAELEFLKSLLPRSP